MLRRLCVCLLLGAFAAAAAPIDAPSPIAAMSIPRLGAGTPDAWRTHLDAASWQADLAPGPFGPGAARISATEKLNVEFTSPAQLLPPATPLAGFLWGRAEGAPARLKLALRENRDNKSLASAEIDLTSEWKPLSLRLPALPAEASGEAYLEVEVRGAASSVSIDGLWFGLCAAEQFPDARPTVPVAAVVLRSALPWGIVNGAAPLSVQPIVAGVVPAGGGLALRAVSTGGASVALPPVLPDESGRWPDTITLDDPALAPYGMYRIEAALRDADGHPVSAMAETLLTRVPEPVPGPRRDSYFGAHVRLEEPDLEAVARLGYKWCRIHDASGITKWGIAEPEPGKWVWADEAVSRARRHGFHILGMLDGAPAWENGNTDSGYFSIYGAPRSVEKWRNYCREVVTHYKGSIDDWEVWNEPWDVNRFFKNGTPLYYAELLKAAYEETKAANPAATVVGVDTYPPIWEKMVLSAGAYPHYDVLSWHRYDPNLHAFPGDAISRVASRINAEQAKYGMPKPLLCSEAGPDVARFHGSFYSFAEPRIVGDWSRGADQYARMYLGAIAAGNQRLFAYTLHTNPRHGQRIQALTEPGIRPKPMHAELAALAYFVDGARYVERLRPTSDISAHLFAQAEARPYASGPSTVVVLHADGEEEQPLPEGFPVDEVQVFDRWGNPAPVASTAHCGLTFIVVPQAMDAALRAWLAPREAAPEVAREQRAAAVDALVDDFLRACADKAALWPFFSTQGSLALISTAEAFTTVSRSSLRDASAAEPFHAAGRFKRGASQLQEAGPFSVGEATLTAADGANAPLNFSVSFDGPGGAPRFLSLAILLAPARADIRPGVEAALQRWEAVFRNATTESLRDAFVPAPATTLLAVSTANGEYFVFDTPDHLRTMLDTAVMWGKALHSKINIDSVHGDAQAATVRGSWDLSSLSLGSGRNPFTAVLVQQQGDWRFASLTFGAPVP